MSIVFGKPERMSAGYARSAMEGLAMATTFEATLDAIELHTDAPVELAVPTTIAWGTRDVLLLPRQGRRWAEALPGSRLVRLPGLGHTPMPDDPAMVVEVIIRTTEAATTVDPVGA